MNQSYRAEISERCALSAMIQWPSKFIPRAAGEGLTREHFSIPSHACIFGLMIDAHRNGRADEVGLPEITEELIQLGKLEDCGGAPGVTAIFTACGGDTASWSLWVRRLREALGRRIARNMAETMSKTSADPTASPEDIAAAHREALDAVTAAMTNGSSTLNAADSTKAFLDRLDHFAAAGALPGLSTGLQPLDMVTGGPKPGELWTISGATSGGKSVLLLQLAGAALREGKRVLIFTLEMGADEVVARIAAGTFNANFSACNHPSQATRGDLEGIRRAVEQITDSGLMVNDSAEINADMVCVESERVSDMEGVDMIVVDYLQLLDGERKRNERQDEEISRNVKRLKQIAKRLAVPVLTASQINDDGKLFASRAIGHHSDVVLGIEDEGILVGKNRNGPRYDLLPLVMAGAKQRFEAR